MPENKAVTVVPATLKRTLSLWQLAFYGLGTILGAGIYVLIGAVAGTAGAQVPLSFLIAAVIAGMTALVYAELSARLPVSAAEAMYVDAAFGRRLLSLTVGLAVVLVAIVSSATIANGFAAYLQVFTPLPPFIAISVLVVTLGAVAAIGIDVSARVAMTITVIEIGGLLLVVAIAGGNVFSHDGLQALTPTRGSWSGIAAGALLAFYAFIGFEDMVNVAEEVREPDKTLPRAIVIALIVSTLLYLLVAVTAVTAVTPAQLAASDAPLAVIVAAHGLDPRIIAAVSLLAVVNGALIQIIMASRVFYGLANAGFIPAALARVHPRTRTPLAATAAVTALVLWFALALPLVRLAAITSVITLLIFATVNAALIAIRLRDREPVTTVQFPLWVPIIAGIMSLALASAEWLA